MRFYKELCRIFHSNVILVTRERDGLAMSSRNAYLSEEERGKATILYHMLQKAVELYNSGNVSL